MNILYKISANIQQFYYFISENVTNIWLQLFSIVNYPKNSLNNPIYFKLSAYIAYPPYSQLAV